MRKTILAAALLLATAPAFAHGPQIGGGVVAGGLSFSGASGAVIAQGGTLADPSAAQFSITGNSGINAGLDGARIVANGYHALEMTAITQNNGLSLGAGFSFDATGVFGGVGGSLGW